MEPKPETPVTCQDMRALLPLFVGADLEHAEDEALRLHLEDCTECCRHAERAGHARVALLEEVEVRVSGPAPDLWPAVRTGLSSAGMLGGVRPKPAPAWSRPRVAALSAAAALLFSVLLTQLIDTPPAPGPGTTGGAGLSVDASPIPGEAGGSVSVPPLRTTPGPARPGSASLASNEPTGLVVPGLRASGALTRVGGGPSSEPSTPPGEVLPLLRRAGPDEVHLIDHARLLPDEQILARPVSGGATFAGNRGSVRYR